MGEADIVVGFVDLRTHGEFFNDIAHGLKTLPVVARFKMRDPQTQCGFGALFLVGVLFAGSRFEMNPSLFIGAVLFQIVISEPHVSDKSVATARIPFEYGIPDLDGFIGFVCIHAGITRFYQFGCCSVFNDGASQTSGRRLSLA